MPVQVERWSIQLQNIDPSRIAELNDDMVVIDYSSDGTGNGAFSPAVIAQLKCKPDRTRRLVIAYFSIGEAEDYRYYWNRDWNSTPPAWLGEENPNWPGNYRVRYWQEDWQNILFGSPEAYLDTIIAAGFDGVFLDIVDGFEYWESRQADARNLMVDLVGDLSRYARSKTPCFAVISQNGEALLQSGTFRNAITALSKEDLFYGIGGDGRANAQAAIRRSLDNLQFAFDNDIPVLDLEYLPAGGKRDTVIELQDQIGLIGTFGERRLDTNTISAPAGLNATTIWTSERLCGF